MLAQGTALLFLIARLRYEYYLHLLCGTMQLASNVIITKMKYSKTLITHLRVSWAITSV